MKHIQSFGNFLNEADKKAKSDKEEKSGVEYAESVDASEGTMKEMKIDGKKYMAVLTTYKALGSKQSSMGQDIVGMISLPGSEQVWELFDKKTAKM